VNAAYILSISEMIFTKATQNICRKIAIDLQRKWKEEFFESGVFGTDTVRF
jgi:hypothetical protein